MDAINPHYAPQSAGDSDFLSRVAVGTATTRPVAIGEIQHPPAVKWRYPAGSLDGFASPGRIRAEEGAPDPGLRPLSEIALGALSLDRDYPPSEKARPSDEVLRLALKGVNPTTVFLDERILGAFGEVWRVSGASLQGGTVIVDFVRA